MKWQERIQIAPDVLAGKPLIRGTRLAVEFIIDLLAQGWSEAEILRNYPGLQNEDIQACLEYTIENQALRYLLTHLGDGISVTAQPLPEQGGRAVDVYGLGQGEPIGRLIFDAVGQLQIDRSSSPDQMRQAAAGV